MPAMGSREPGILHARPPALLDGRLDRGARRGRRRGALVVPAPATTVVGVRSRGRPPINTRSRGSRRSGGTPSRTYYGEGPVPCDPSCGGPTRATARRCARMSAEGGDGLAGKEWCGTGWTGQPNVVPDARRIDAGARGRVRRALPLPRCRVGRAARCPTSSPATSRRARRRPTPTATRCTTRARATTCSAWSRRIAPSPRCSGRSTRTTRRSCRTRCGTTTGTALRS